MKTVFIEIIQKSGVFGAGVVLGSVIAVWITRAISNSFFKTTPVAAWQELVNSIKAERNRYCARVQFLEKELDKIRKGARR